MNEIEYADPLPLGVKSNKVSMVQVGSHYGDRWGGDFSPNLETAAAGI